MTIKRIFNRTNERELGFGNTITTKGRLMNQDGSFNVDRKSQLRWQNIYHYLVTMPWIKFILLIIATYTVLNFIFALLYCAVGIEHLAGTEPGNFQQNLMEAYFFSSQTLTTVGYGRVSPQGLTANILASFESLGGLMSFALISGLLYGRFSRPVSNIIFSEKMLIAPYKGGKALMFRMANAKKSELIETETRVILTINQEDENGNVYRRFHNLELEIKQISFMALSWTIVHPLDEKSPVAGFTIQDLENAVAEIIVLIKGTDDTYAQTVFARHSYTANDVVADAKFSPIISRNHKDIPRLFAEDVSNYEMLETTNHASDK